MKVTQFAAEYLEDKPANWVKLANSIAAVVHAHCIRLATEQDTSGDYASRLMFAELSAPQLVRAVRDCPDDQEAQEIIITALSNLLAKDIYVEFDETNYKLSSIVKDCIKDLGKSALIVPHAIYRLDVIDTALYRTLLHNPELLRKVDWRTFEKLLADILESFGYEIELQRGTKDGGVDLFAIKKIDPFGPQRFLIQAKRYSNKVGVEPVRQLAFLHSHFHVTKSCLATTAKFTRRAWELARQYQWQIELRDIDGVHDWIKQVATLKV